MHCQIFFFFSSNSEKFVAMFAHRLTCWSFGNFIGRWVDNPCWRSGVNTADICIFRLQWMYGNVKSWQKMSVGAPSSTTGKTSIFISYLSHVGKTDNNLNWLNYYLWIFCVTGAKPSGLLGVCMCVLLCVFLSRVWISVAAFSWVMNYNRRGTQLCTWNKWARGGLVLNLLWCKAERVFGIFWCFSVT